MATLRFWTIFFFLNLNIPTNNKIILYHPWGWTSLQMNIQILFWIAPAILHWKLNQLHLTVHFSKCQTVTALPLIEKLNRYKMILNNILERRNDFEKHFWKIGYSFMAIKGRYNCKYRKSLRPCKHCPLIKHLLFPENAMDGNSNSNHWKN